MRPAFILTAVIYSMTFLGCAAQYTLIKSERVKVNEFLTVDPQIEWSKKNSGNLFFWTANGSALDRIVFINGVAPSQTLFGEESGLQYKKEMNEIEIAELFTQSFKVLGKWGQVKTQGLQEHNIGPYPGFRFGLQLVSQKGLDYLGDVAGTVIEEKLYLIFFVATREYYYPQYRMHFENILASAQKA